MKQFKLDPHVEKTVPLMLKARVAQYPDVKIQAQKDKNGNFAYYSYAETYEKIIALALALRTLGIHRESNVALISDNRREWLISDIAIQALGGADVPRGCDSLGKELRFIISFADCECGIFENVRQLAKILENEAEVPALKTAILFDKPTEKEAEVYKDTKIKVIFFEDLLAEGEKLYAANPAALKAEIEAEMEKSQPDDVATIIFTSGTTGTPKGAMITNNNFMSQISTLKNFITCKPNDWWMTILPVWHIFERFIQYVALYFTCGLAYSKPVASVLLKDITVIRPDWICGVPRLWEALAAGVNKKMVKTGGATLKIFRFFVKCGTLYANFRDMVFGNVCQFKKRSRLLDAILGFIPWILFWPLHKLGDLLVFKKIRAAFGGNLRIAISGGGALQKSTDNFYRAIGLNLLEGYGLTETSPVISFRYYKHPRPGCVGVIFPTWEVKIVSEENGVITGTEDLGPGKQGMILVKGSQLMKGYYKRPDLTEKAIDKDGFFNTGDIGIMTYDHELKITGRAKDTIVLLGGENIEPTVLESELCTSDLIESVMVVGQDKKALGALIVPSKDAVEEYAKTKGLDISDYEGLLSTDTIVNLFNEEIGKKISISNGFRPCERINKIALIPNSFKVGEELSAKQEMMRYKIAEKYADEIKELFD